MISTDTYLFPLRLMKSDGVKGYIDAMWHYLDIELRNPDLLARSKYKMCRETSKYSENLGHL
jgi:hypothetical protein